MFDVNEENAYGLGYYDYTTVEYKITFTRIFNFSNAAPNLHEKESWQEFLAQLSAVMFVGIQRESSKKAPYFSAISGYKTTGEMLSQERFELDQSNSVNQISL